MVKLRLVRSCASVQLGDLSADKQNAWGGLLGLLKSFSESLLYEIFVRCELNRSEVNICGKRTDVNLGDPELREGAGKGRGGAARDEERRMMRIRGLFVGISSG